ncbi:MAG: hypothetical protein AB1801_04240, partial [Chloroflexota bacterium]
MLKLAGSLSFVVAVFQAVITFSPAMSRYFGAPEVLLAHRGWLIITGLGAAAIFGLFGWYAFAGAGCPRPLPLLRIALLGIGSLYTLRGLLLVPQLLMILGYVPASEPTGSQMLISSAVSLVIGLLYLVGTWQSWRNLPKMRRR